MIFSKVRVERNVQRFQEKRKNGMNVKFSAKCVAVIAQAQCQCPSLPALAAAWTVPAVPMVVRPTAIPSRWDPSPPTPVPPPHTARPKSPASSWLWTRSTPRVASTARRSSSSPWTIRRRHRSLQRLQQARRRRQRARRARSDHLLHHRSSGSAGRPVQAGHHRPGRHLRLHRNRQLPVPHLLQGLLPG